jgi:bifunctional enzyme CysN/CysC
MSADTHNAEKTLLRFITCGSVDDGKSTLLGRLLVETGSAYEDELAGCGGDLSRLVDGLEAEREQGITIDVAYRFFTTDKRKFIVADAPGHEQYTRNLVTGASTADLALVLVDARKGVLTQTRRHSFCASCSACRKLVLLVNKMDMVGYDRRRGFGNGSSPILRRVAEDFVAIPAPRLGRRHVGDRSDSDAWYEGPTLLEHRMRVEPAEGGAAPPSRVRMPVQWVTRPARTSAASPGWWRAARSAAARRSR